MCLSGANWLHLKGSFWTLQAASKNMWEQTVWRRVWSHDLWSREQAWREYFIFTCMWGTQTCNQYLNQPNKPQQCFLKTHIKLIKIKVTQFHFYRTDKSGFSGSNGSELELEIQCFFLRHHVTLAGAPQRPGGWCPWWGGFFWCP